MDFFCFFIIIIIIIIATANREHIQIVESQVPVAVQNMQSQKW